MINVKDMGAIGDGVADDTAAIQSAINAHKAVYLPEGIYNITSELVITNSSQKIYGDGWTSKIKCASINAIRVTPMDDVGGMILKDFSIVGTPLNGIFIDLDAPNTVYLRESMIDHIYCEQTIEQCIKLINTNKTNGYFTSSIVNCRLMGGINLLRAGDSLHIDKNTISGLGHGINISFVPGASMTQITRNNVTSTDYGLILGDAPTKVRIAYNHFEKWQANSVYSDYHVLLSGSPTNYGLDCELIGNSISPIGHAYHALGLYCMARTYINNNIIYDTGNTVNSIYLLPNASETFFGKRNIITGPLIDQGQNTAWE